MFKADSASPKGVPRWSMKSFLGLAESISLWNVPGVSVSPSGGFSVLSDEELLEKRPKHKCNVSLGVRKVAILTTYQILGGQRKMLE